MFKIPTRIRISGLGRSRDNKHPNRRIDGDLMIYNQTYRKWVNVLLSWQADPEIKKFVDKNGIKFVTKVKNDNIELYFYYPRTFKELCNFIEKEYNTVQYNITLSIVDNFDELQYLLDHIRSLQK